MDADSLYVGATLLLQGTHQNPNNFHMCVVLSDPEKSPARQVLYVPIITCRKKYDATCILNVGDHPFVKHKSCIHYEAIGQRPERFLLRVGKLSTPLEADVLRRVLEGVMCSPHSKPWVKDFLLSI